MRTSRNLYILSQLKEIPGFMEIRLYRDDRLAVLDQTPQRIENQKRNLQSVPQKQPSHHHRSKQKDY